MSDVSNALYSLTIEGSRDPLTELVNYGLILPRTLIVPKNSGIQIVWSNLEHALARAERFKEPFRSQAIKAVMADFKGVISLSSELGAYLREFTTTRGAVPIGQNVGQEATWVDEYFHEQLLGKKGMLKNNPRKEGLGLDL